MMMSVAAMTASPLSTSHHGGHPVHETGEPLAKKSKKTSTHIIDTDAMKKSKVGRRGGKKSNRFSPIDPTLIILTNCFDDILKRRRQFRNSNIYVENTLFVEFNIFERSNMLN